jgi:UDP-glucuronate decarboxylase
MKKILVTGGAGFIGSNLIGKLLYETDDYDEPLNEIICVDNLYSGNKRNIYPYTKEPNFTFILHDVTFPLYLEVDEIYHLACPASPIHYQRDPVQTTKTCVMGTINMLGLAKRTNAKILQASTSEIYGDPQVHPQTEDYWGNVNPIGIRACYDEGKRCAETLCMDYYRQYNVYVNIARIFNTYGPNMCVNDGRVVSNFICQALQNQDITVYGDGLQTRSFCYIEDLINGLITIMNCEDDGLFPLNLGNPNELKVIDLANQIIDLTNSSSKIIKKELPSDDPKQRQPDISTIQDLGWNPVISLEKGLIQTIDYFENRLYMV